ncbi:MAG TPA: hypothetical protein VNO14_18420 [Blastocatellia bacterium]|nr:hypothetical protein [Blastocatellia bacterium]
MKYFSLSIILLCLLAAGCGPRKPAYSDIQTDAEGRAVNSNDSEQTASQPEQSPAAQAQPNPAPAQKAEFKMPEFIDTNTGQIKDLPSYPNATRVTQQYGPVQGTQSAAILLQTRDSVDKIAAFYDRAIKSNGWKVLSDQRDQGVMKIEVQKGDRNQGQVNVFRDDKTGVVSISISRIERPVQPKQ